MATETIAFAWTVILAFLRLSTHPAVFPRPLSSEQAIGALERWIAAPPAVIVEPARRHLALLRGLVGASGAGGNLVSDAHLAALALEHGATVLSFGRDFGRFEGLPGASRVDRVVPDCHGRPVTDLARRFSALYTAAVADVLDGLGFLRQTLPPELVPLMPGMRLAGPAFTVEGRPLENDDYDSSIRRFLSTLGEVPPGTVAVYATGDRESAQFGELSAASLQGRGCAGVVLDGGCRDVDFIVATGFPVFARYTTPRDSVLRWNVTASGEDVTIGDVTVGTGDYVLGDADGIVVVPAARIDEVLERAEAVAGTENEIRAAVGRGLTPLEAYERYGKF